ncbi:MAG TPA: cytochrome c [Longimicrobiaceae bacterium]|nr:cytochrome c [Longimicrobiaceae bacterium]
MRNARKRLAVALPLAAVLASGCRPGTEGGYDKVTHRRAPVVVEPTNPSLPPPGPGVLAGPAGQKVTLANAPAGVTQQMVDAGQELYGTVCVACHGPGGAGSAAAPPLNDATWLNVSGAYPEIVQVINTGVPTPREFPGAMPPKGGGSFDDEQVRQLAAYVYALSHPGGGS